MFQKIIDELNEHGPAVENLKKNASSLVSKSESEPFKAMESRINDVYTVWLELTKETRERLETLQQWLRLIDDYERNVDDLNAWVDRIEKSVDLLGYQEKREDLLAELEELKVRVFVLYFCHHQRSPVVLEQGIVLVLELNPSCHIFYGEI